MLLIGFIEGRIVQGAHHTIALEAEKVACERLGAGIDEGAFASGPAYYGGEDSQRDVIVSANAALGHRPVEIDIGAGAIFGGDAEPLVAPHIGRAAGRDDLALEAGLLGEFAGFGEERFRRL